MVSAAPVRLADYSPWPFALPAIHLAVDIRPRDVLVTSRLELEPRGGVDLLELRGVDLEICSIRLNGDDLASDAYTYTDQLLTIHSPPSAPFVLETCCRIDPYSNSSLEGLYASGGLLSTQCEAEGFRRISFHPDRPRCAEPLDGADRSGQKQLSCGLEQWECRCNRSCWLKPPCGDLGRSLPQAVLSVRLGGR